MALQLHRAGQLLQAETAYRNILIDHPNHADALHLLGMVVNQSGRHDEAEKLIRQAIFIQPREPVFFSNLGLVLASANKMADAIDAYQIAELLNPASAENLNNLGVALHLIGRGSDAIDCFKRAFLLQPNYTDACTNLIHLLGLQPNSAAAFHALGDLLFEGAQSEVAAGWYRRSLQIHAESAETQNNLGNALFAAGRWAEAAVSYREALRISPDFPQAWNNLANVLKESGQIEESAAAYTRAIELQPQSAEPLSNLGNLFRELKQFDAAMACYQKSLAINPEHATTHNNVGNLHCEKGEWDAAIQAYSYALAARPDYADAINNLGTALEETGQRDSAMECYRKAFAMDRNLVSPPWNIALLQLLRGEYAQGWAGYENRWRQKKQSKTWRDFEQPTLIALPLPKGTRVLLHAEQGFGDAIQFCRYAPMLAQLGMQVTLECPALLVRLFGCLPGITRVISRGDLLPDFDVHCPLMSLPKVFSTTLATIPNQPYLHADEPDIATRKKNFENEPPAFRVGLVWAGQSTHQKDRHRSVSLADFAGLGKNPNIRFYSLQMGEPSKQAKSPPVGMQLIDWTTDLHDFADTAALISQLDLVITVDTAVCHLTAAMGVPVWILVAFQPDWRWLLDREDSPWYPTAKLFRQTIPNNWSTPLKNMATELNTIISRWLRPVGKI